MGQAVVTPEVHMEILVGDTIYFSAHDGSSGYELWAHDTSNHSTWQVLNLNGGNDGNPGYFMEILVGDTLYFSAKNSMNETANHHNDELWAHSTSNHSSWLVADINSGSWQ